jgi:PAS domain-containing protein
VRWTDLTPAEWHDCDERAVADLNATGIFQPFEKEFFRKNGSRVPVLLAGALFEGSKNEGVAFVLDLSEQKQAEREREKLRAHLTEAQRLTHTGSWARRLVDRKMKTEHLSEEWYRIYGFDPAEERRLGKNISNESTRRIALSGRARSNGQSWKKPITIRSSASFFRTES